MRFLANENFPGDAVAELQRRGYEVAWILEETSGASDRDVLARAQAEGRLLLTFDKDFGELAFRAQLPASSGIILFRISAPSVEHAVRVIVSALESRLDWAGHFAALEDNPGRLTPLPRKSPGA